MQTLELVTVAANAGLAESAEIFRRIDGLRQVRALCGRLAPGRERRYMAVMVAAAAASTNGSARTAALLELDLLSLELCDD
jgi:hypothetical protein